MLQNECVPSIYNLRRVSLHDQTFPLVFSVFRVRPFRSVEMAAAHYTLQN